VGERLRRRHGDAHRPVARPCRSPSERTPRVRLDPSTRKVVAVIRPGADCSSGCATVLSAGGGVWVATDTSIVRVDPATNKVTATVRLAAPGGDAPSVGVATTGSELWVATGDHVDRIDPKSGALLSKTTIPRAYFVNLTAAAGRLDAWDGNSNKVDELRLH
jgi:DNA-binding beta-propeller fold protein YncE